MQNNLNQILRPKTWDEIVGQSDIKEIVQTSIRNGNFPKFSVFSGPTGVGKSCMAELAAKSLLCTSETRPCLKCTGCVRDANVSIIKYNMASMLGKKDIVSVLDSIFKYEGINHTTIYILEEVQVLKQKEEQTPFLEELTKIPDGVYVMMCTTKISSLLPALRNRATNFALTIPTTSECVEYITRIMDTLGWQPMSKSAMTSLAVLSEYTPRNIVKHIELLTVNGSLTEDTMNKFFKTVSKQSYIRLLGCIVDPDITTQRFVKVLAMLQEDISCESLLQGFKNFALTVLIEVCVGTADPSLSRSERNSLTEVLAKVGETKYILLMDKIANIKEGAFSDTQSAMYEMIRLKMFSLGLTVTETFKHNADNASAQQAKATTESRAAVARATPRVNVSRISSNDEIATIVGVDTGTVVIEE